MNIGAILKSTNLHKDIHDPNAPKLVIDLNKVVEMVATEGVEVNTQELEDGVDVRIRVLEGAIIERPVHLCFGISHDKAIQRIVMNVDIEPRAQIKVLSHCIFPTAVDIQHIMDGKINIGEGSRYIYEERHIHSEQGGIRVLPKAKVYVGPHAQFKTDFELVKGRVGKIDINYETICDAHSITEMTAKISGRSDDEIELHETGYLNGEGSVGVLNTRVAVRDTASAKIYNKLVAMAPYARGHVDCKEIIQDHATASAIPIVDVRNPKAHITHEAAIGSVDNKQLETLMARGLNEDEAVDLIIEGLLETQ